MSQGVTQFQPSRLREVREARGLTGVALTELLGLKQSASISQYETDRRVPTLETLRRIADVLRVPIHHFYLPSRPQQQGLLFWRSQAAAARLDRLRAERKYEWLVGVMDYVSSLVSLPPAKFPSPQVPADPRELDDTLIESLATDCRRFWSLGDGPISNVVLLLENNGAVVVRTAMGSDALDAYSHWNHDHGRPYFTLGTDKESAARSLVDTAHELAHMILHRSVEERFFNSGEIHKLMESQAMRFAGAFLLPMTTFAPDLYSVSLDAFVTLKSKWRVSVQAMITRAAHLEIISPDETRRLWIRVARRGWRQHEPLDDTLEPEEPRMIRKCFDLLMDGNFDPDAMAATVALPLSDIEEVCGLPFGYFDNQRESPFKFKLVG